MTGTSGHQYNSAKESLLDRIAVDTGYDKPKGIAAGFVPACDFIETCELVANLAYVLSQRGVVVCVVDFKVFYPNLFDWLGGACADKKGDGLIRLLNSDRTEVKSVAKPTDDPNVFLVSPSPNDDIEDYFNYSIDDVGRIIGILKQTFDVVLIDIPNNPALEFCAGALMHCQKGFFVASERIDASRNIQKLMEFAFSFTNNARSFNNVILGRYQRLIYDDGLLTETRLGGAKDGVRLRMVARIPYSRDAQQCALDGKVFIRDGTFTSRKLAKDGKIYSGEMENIANMILEVDS
jgi:septum formation inhibitor-activating ATPase MinD